MAGKPGDVMQANRSLGCFAKRIKGRRREKHEQRAKCAPPVIMLAARRTNAGLFKIDAH
jgi:hypothetical protein